MREKMKNWICISLIMMLLAIIVTPVQTKAAESLKLNKTSVVLCTGQGYRLKVNTTKKVTWKSTKTSVAIVSDTGKIAAKKPGAAYIVVQYGKEKVSCKVIVKDHTWKRTAFKNATCKEKGYKKYKCEKCGKAKTTSISVLKHKWITQKRTIHHKEKGHYETSLSYKKVGWVLCTCGLKIYATELQPILDHEELPPFITDGGYEADHYYRIIGEDRIPEIKKVWKVDVPGYDEVITETICSHCKIKK